MNIGIVALIFTFVIGFIFKKHKSWLMTFLQNFTGVLFIFSGWVKAVDPLGTGYKMEQYFGEFEKVFTGTWFNFLSPLFPALSKVSIWFSVAMIVFEIVLGIMLILGVKSKLTSWLFLGLVAFFTVLTGFTYLTGYVPSDVNFFNFGAWSEYKESNMKVTDCGCFGDFIKLKPKISFFKDVFLLIPAIYFVFKHKDMHELFSPKVRNWIIGLSTLALLVYCYHNSFMNEPPIDFRPFKIGTDVAAQRKLEEEAAAKVQITHWILKHLKSGEKLTLETKEYMANLSKYNADEYKVVDQIKTLPTIERSKISEFEVTAFDGNDMTEKYLANPKNHFMIVCYKGKYTTTSSTKLVQDSIITIDTIVTKKDTNFIKKASIVQSEKTATDYIWNDEYKADLLALKPFLEKAMKDGHEVSIVMGGINADAANDLKAELDLNAEFYTADDILLKTIIRSNPGIVLWKDGKILDHWHKSKLPAYEVVKEDHRL
jgi:uncharacterized membrane protein YphA (DoxX/SURF4 family)